jgi:hypothetical protein
MASKSFQALVLGALLLVGGPLAVSLFAEDEKRWEANPLHSGGSEIAFEWQYACPNGRGCSFTCPGSGGASNVTNLASGGASNATNLADVKEYWWYSEATPTGSWLRWRYHYPQAEFPYAMLRQENAKRNKDELRGPSTSF